jgi:transcriptional regulator with XRE-family HTH domain
VKLLTGQKKGLRPKMEMQLKFIREAKGMTQDHLGSLAGLSKSFISQLETGARQPSTDTLSALATALDVPTSALLSQTGFCEPGAGDTIARRILEQLDQKPTGPEHEFRVGTDGKLVQIVATVDRVGIDRLIQKLEAMKLLLDT